jgi:FkbM family methyltransferase
LIRSVARQLLGRFGYTVHSGPCERTFTTELGNLLRHVQPTAVLDVGAGVGEYPIMCRHLGFSGPVHSFEPMPENYMRVAERAAADPAWHTYNFALGDTESHGQMQRLSSWSFHSFYPLNAFGASAFQGLATQESVDVVIHRLDHLWDEISPGDRVWLKCDTQGHDLAVLAGVSDRIANVAVLQVEIPLHPIYEGVPEFMDVLTSVSSLGFEPWAFDVVNFDPRLRVMEFDGLFVRR